MKKIIMLIAYLLAVTAYAIAADDSMTRLSNETLQFFVPSGGKIISVDDRKITMEMNAKTALRPGMRLNILKEGEPFRHPVTGEILGRVESAAGKAEVQSLQQDIATGIIVDGTARVGDKVRISETKVKMVFIQDKKVDWYLADDLYRKLKASGRIVMIDSAVETDDVSKALEEAKRLNADVLLLITAKEADKSTLLREQLFWASDGARFFDAETKIDVAFTKELRFGGEFFTPFAGEAIFRYDLPYTARYVVTGDFDGDGKQEIAVSNGKDVFTYFPAGDLKPLWELKGVPRGNHVWLDAIDLNGNGRDELVITVMSSGGGLPDNRSGESMVTAVQPGDVISLVYELSGTEFKKIWEANYFLRKTGTTLVGQLYSSSEGFKGDVFTVSWDGQYKRGETMKLPRGVNVYDFTVIEGQGSERFLLAYDEKGFLNMFDDKGIRIWRSAESTGGFINSFRKESTVSYIEGDTWSIKDRLLSRNRESLIIRRIPLAEMVKGIGYKNSRIQSYWWSGFGMEERTLIDDIPGAAADYALAGDKLLVLTTPFLGVKFENILKGESPLGSTLFIYSAKGR